MFPDKEIAGTSKTAEVAEIPTSDGRHTETTEITASITPPKLKHIRYTPDELLKLRPASMSPSPSGKHQINAPVQTPTHPTHEKDRASAKGIKLEAQQKPDKYKATKVVAFQDEDKADRGLHGCNEEKSVEKTDADGAGAANPTENQVTPADGAAAEPIEPEKKKKKRNKKSSGQKGRGKTPNPTGFEEFYADPPITPAEYNEEVNELYHHARPFAERIETCIQRYRSKRKLGEVRSNIFLKYLTLGGIDTTIKAFSGGKAEKEDDMDDYDGPTIHNINGYGTQFKELFANNTDQDAVSKYYNPNAPQNWEVDFEGIAKAFLSNRAPYIFGRHNREIINTYCDVVKNFLNYVLMHSVCPEHTPSIIAAQKLCDLAKTELWAITQLAPVFPGAFHQALSILTGGYYARLHVAPEHFAPEEIDPQRHFSLEHAGRIVRAAVALMGSEAQFEALNRLGRGEAPRSVSEEELGFEVVGITLPSRSVKEAFLGIKNAAGQTGTIAPLGYLECKRWIRPPAPTLDLTKEEEAEIAAHPPTYPNEMFWVAGDVLEECFVGMKFEAVVRETDGGIRYIDHLRGMDVSFFHWVENERMGGWKEPRENERKAPSCEDAEAPEGEGEGEDVAADD